MHVYKHTAITAETLRKERVDEQELMRRRKREEQLARLRQMVNGDELTEGLPPVHDPQLISLLGCGDPSKALKAMGIYRLHLSSSSSSAKEEIIALGLVPLFVQVLLDSERGSSLEVVTLSVLTHLSIEMAEERNQPLEMDPSLLSRLLPLINGTQALELLLCVKMPPYLLSTHSHLISNLIERTIEVLINSTSTSDITLSLLCIDVVGKYHSLQHSSDWLPPYLKLLKEGVLVPTVRKDLIEAALSTLASIASTSEGHCELVIASGLIPSIRGALHFEGCMKAALEVYTSIILNDKGESSKALFDDMWMALEKDLFHQKHKQQLHSAISSAIVRVMSHMAGNASLLTERGILPKLISTLAHGQYRMRKEALSAIHALVVFSSDETISYVLESGGYLPIVDMLTVMDVEAVLCALECVDRVLAWSKGGETLKSDQLQDKLEFLLKSLNLNVYVLAHEILEKYFNEDEE